MEFNSPLITKQDNSIARPSPSRVCTATTEMDFTVRKHWFKCETSSHRTSLAQSSRFLLFLLLCFERIKKQDTYLAYSPRFLFSNLLLLSLSLSYSSCLGFFFDWFLAAAAAFMQTLPQSPNPSRYSKNNILPHKKVQIVSYQTERKYFETFCRSTNF